MKEYLLQLFNQILNVVLVFLGVRILCILIWNACTMSVLK